MVAAGFILSLLFFVAIGVLSSRYSTATNEDYLLAGRSTPTWIIALSAAATSNSGFMFIKMRRKTPSFRWRI